MLFWELQHGSVFGIVLPVEGPEEERALGRRPGPLQADPPLEGGNTAPTGGAKLALGGMAVLFGEKGRGGNGDVRVAHWLGGAGLGLVSLIKNGDLARRRLLHHANNGMLEEKSSTTSQLTGKLHGCLASA